MLSIFFKVYLNKLLYVSFVGVFGLRINSSDMQCRWLSVWNVYFNFEHTFLPKLFFPEGLGGVHNTHGNSEGWEGH